MVTEICSLRDRGEPQERDVLVTRHTPWGNPFSIERVGMMRVGRNQRKNALDRYRRYIAEKLEEANSFTGGLQAQRWVRDFKALAGKRLLCACTAEAMRQGACHAVVMAEELEKLTGIGYRLPEEREEP